MKEEIPDVLEELSKCDTEFGEVGLSVFLERASVWSGNYDILIRFEALDEDNFECLVSTIERLNKCWKVVEIADESFFMIYCP